MRPPLHFAFEDDSKRGEQARIQFDNSFEKLELFSRYHPETAQI
jgi:hypothetical protein